MQSVIVVVSVFVLIGLVLMLGFLFRPTMASIRKSMKKESMSYIEKVDSIAKLSDTQKEQMRTCQGNQAMILSAATSYYAKLGKYPPGGTITKDSPLVKEGFLSAAPTCPATGKEYSLSLHAKPVPPSTDCPSGIWYHDFNLGLR